MLCCLSLCLAVVVVLCGSLVWFGLVCTFCIFGVPDLVLSHFVCLRLLYDSIWSRLGCCYSLCCVYLFVGALDSLFVLLWLLLLLIV